MQHQDDKTGRACKCPACFVERYSVHNKSGPAAFMASLKPRWQPWPESHTVRTVKPYGHTLADMDFAAIEKAWHELEAAVKADIARERGVPVEKVRFVYGEGAMCDSITVEIEQ